MRLIKYTLMACATAALVGCATYHEDRDAQGRPQSEYGTYQGSSREPGIIEGLNRGVNTNYFGPVNSGADAARGVGSSSGGASHVVP